jgi:DNA-binding SARP family transcriptional activator/tetratricopeptide (TPR) repeat protein
MNSLAVRVLGEFAVDGIEPRALGSRKARLALQLLALGGGRAVPADVLADALWADAPPARPDDQLAVLMSRLRSVLGRDRIEHRDGGYLLHADWRDATELAQLIEEIDRRRNVGNAVGAAAAARVALSLLGGAEPAQPPGEWAQLRRAALDRLIIRGRLTASAALLAAGDWIAAVDGAAAALERDPYEEAALRTLMRAYAAGGQPAAALSVYASARERLAGDLGTDPSAETDELHATILRGQLPSIPASAARQAGPASLVGRADELAFLDTCAAKTAAGDAAVVVIDGEPGIGKTSLLRAWAARYMTPDDGQRPVLLVTCGPLDRSLPLDALLTALGSLLRWAGDVTELLGQDAALLGPLLHTPANPLLHTTSSPRPAPALADSLLGPTVLYGALARVLRRLAGRGLRAVLVDDAHLAGRPLRDFIDFLRREEVPLLIVASVRSGVGEPLPATALVHLDVLDRDAAAQLVGARRADTLYRRSRGNPLFLTELAQQAAGAPLPASLVDSVSARCDELGPAGALLRTAAVIGPDLDLDLLAAILGRPVIELLDACERAVAQQFLADTDGQLRFRHELVREALAASATSGRAALLHRQAGRVLARRPAADPVTVAQHARLGGDLALAALALRDAAARVAEGFDHTAAETLLDDALSLHPDAEGWLDRARVRTRRGRYREALEDVERAGRLGAAGFEVGAWASYFGRNFAQATQFAEDGAITATDSPARARCLAVAGRTRHASGDLAGGEAALAEAIALAEGADRVAAAAWLGVLRAHQSRPAEALPLLRPAARGQVGAEHTAATMHALLFTGHAHAIAGRPAAALTAFARHTAEVDRRHVPRFAGRSVNFTGWVLRNLGDRSRALDCHTEAMEAGRQHGTADVAIAVLEDLAEMRIDDGDPDDAARLLAEAGVLLAEAGDLVFGWRLALKHDLITARLALLQGNAEQALATANRLAGTSASLGVPRYASAARVLGHRAGRRLGNPVNMGAVEADLEELAAAVAIEAWWWTGDAAADFGVPAWLDRAARLAGRLADHAGPHAATLRREADKRMQQWKLTVR